MEDKIDARLNEIMDESRASFLVSIDKDGHLHTGFDGPVELIIAAIAGGMVHLQRESEWSCEDIGKEFSEIFAAAKEAFDETY